MAKLILHIGMVKTGSSAIQASLASATGGDFIYPQLGGVASKGKNGASFKRNHDDALVNLFSSNSEKIAAKRNSFGKATYAADSDEQAIRQAAADAGERPVILSSEALSGRWQEKDVFAFRRFADELFDDVKIVGYVREPYSLISATFWTRIKGAGLASFEPAYRHYKRLRKFDAAFGRENVALWEYDRDVFPNRNVVQHFCANVGIEPVASPKLKNITLSRPAVSAIYRLNRLLRDDPSKAEAHKTARLAIGREFPHRDWPKFRLSPRVVAPLIEANGGDIRWIEQRLGSPLLGDAEPQDGDVTSETDLLDIPDAALEQLETIGRGLPSVASDLLRRALAG